MQAHHDRGPGLKPVSHRNGFVLLYYNIINIIIHFELCIKTAVASITKILVLFQSTQFNHILTFLSRQRHASTIAIVLAINSGLN